MPTVLRIGALRVAVYPNDHRPAHVHVIGRGHEAVFILKGPLGSIALRENSPRANWPILKQNSRLTLRRS
jgi:hypothetical protein